MSTKDQWAAFISGAASPGKSRVIFWKRQKSLILMEVVSADLDAGVVEGER
jgi:hypothetical protein